VTRAQRLIKRGAKLLDVLPSAVYAFEHLPGAMSLPLETLSQSSIADLDRGEAYIVYCFDQH
jgi:rhodanese-related sulfurtransferase